MDVRQFEDKRWAGEDQKMQFRHRACLELIESGTVLDLGSGDGLLLSLLKKKGISGRGLDLSQVGVNKARAKGLETEVFDFANQALPFPDDSFDTVTMLDVLEHLYNPEFVIREAKRVARKNLIIGVPNFSSLPARSQTLFGRVPENNRPKKGHVYWFNFFILQDILKRNNISQIEWRANVILENFPILGSLTRLLSKIWPNLFCLSFVVKVKI